MGGLNKNICAIIEVQKAYAEPDVPHLHWLSRSPSPSLVTTGVILEQVSVGPRWFLGCTGKEKNFPRSSPLLIRSSNNYHQVTFIRSGFPCFSVKVSPPCPSSGNNCSSFVPQKQFPISVLSCPPISGYEMGGI